MEGFESCTGPRDDSGCDIHRGNVGLTILISRLLIVYY